ncbi:MAG: Pyruvate kinase II [Candidatus Accumulibacter regalis]|jgi:pyruvate kinase|uniref:Pyruvate kinase n=1 Tax=Accumulibacter regalis TaxID=522306 RepID=A0A011P0G7_ACCRE|nr:MULTISPECIES: pyruvate kinase [unclassified Candidatus Accumulibacter]EXI88453.1 MAG: Pyruvate kinase II [Candidatus Accumulibacter regalis]MQM35395.1 pyruvate kinase [Candidatus Accumulibacter phosphatis]MBL8367759.1 pyruvate kinase [Accumulibacter sp.]MBN8513118.1 pyruvate kinase [Accumulibacter sp.]MBO3704690.1 pyruvate kinase [Accumulibacter sp.]
MPRDTKIVATLGPASSDADVLERMIRAGVDVVRLNFSHGKPQDHIARAQLVREAAARVGRPVGILADLQGPKIRVGKFADGKIWLDKGAPFILDAKCELGNADRAGLDYKDLTRDVSAGSVLLLDDGRIVLDVQRVLGSEIFTIVRHGGELSDNKGINRQGGGLSAAALTAKDMDDIRTAASIDVDFVAISFPKSAADMYMARQLMHAAGGHALTIAKIERVEAVAALEEIISASDGIMVARGDLAVEVGDAAVPALQKRMIRMARERNKLVITATQMMESMIVSPAPTRAEVSDVANAVLDGTDAVMLSAETAAGRFPVETIEAMARICLEAEKSAEVTLEREFLNQVFTRIDQTISLAAIWAAHHLKVKAIAALTESGSTALWMSRLNCGVPVYALTPRSAALTKMSLYRAVFPVLMDQQPSSRDELLYEAEQLLMKENLVEKGDFIVLTAGEPMGNSGGTNTLKIVRVGDQQPAAS